ncbi:peptidylprolyl isomerase [Prevotella sp.]|uniref:peptidylprolyl isomerase n=1 Tax=Prevotella sp. TaxID=59823 RepID=UPI002648A313|nr:peptidylprolyl isomerase [Prevotella sp.]MDN5554445.1 peptidylprolyl isomerase [Prevotella sp.]
MRCKKTISVLTAMLLNGSMVFAQSADPVLMTINGKPILRSEFEYSYNKNNSNGVIDKKSVDDYVDLFINYKLKVEAALDAHLDTMKSYQNEFASYRDKQIRPSVISDADIETEAYHLYNEIQKRVDSHGGIVKVAHILLRLNQRAPQEKDVSAKLRIDSIYKVLLNGADFAQLAKKYSDDKESAVNGGELPWIQYGQTFPEFEKQAFAIKKGQISKPFMSPVGYHIILKKDSRNFFPYDSLRNDIIKFIEQRGIRENMINARLDSISKLQHVTVSDVLEKKTQEMESEDPSLKYLIKEYHDGLLMFEISNRTVWKNAATDEAALSKYFKKNKKRYKWEQPRFKGIAYHTKYKDDLKAVKKILRKTDFSEWSDILKRTFNKNSARILVDEGLFKIGDNLLVDNFVFKQNKPYKHLVDYPYENVYGKKLKSPADFSDVRQLVVNDYQEYLEKGWVETLRKKYPVSVNHAVLATVNKH